DTDLSCFISENGFNDDKFEHVYHVVDENDQETFEKLIVSDQINHDAGQALKDGQVVHEINMSVYYDFNVDDDNNYYDLKNRYFVDNVKQESPSTTIQTNSESHVSEKAKKKKKKQSNGNEDESNTVSAKNPPEGHKYQSRFSKLKLSNILASR
ncbi:unnamed protein product, partial [Didymodactylos carnosus]